jgi:hypothetical protein
MSIYGFAARPVCKKEYFTAICVNNHAGEERGVRGIAVRSLFISPFCKGEHFRTSEELVGLG